MPAVTGYLCTDCGRSHAPKDRQRAIRPMAHMTPAEIVETWQCFYDDGQGNDGAGYRMVCRDLEAVRAELARKAPKSAPGIPFPEAAKLAGVSSSTLSRIIARGGVQKVGRRVDPVSLRAFIEQRRAS